MIYNNLGPLRDFIPFLPIPTELVNAERLPVFLDEIFVLGYEIEERISRQLSFTVGFSKEFAIHIPGIQYFHFVIGGDTKRFSIVSLHVQLDRPRSVEFRRINFGIRFDPGILRPVADTNAFAQIACDARLKITQDLSFELDAFNKFSLAPSFIGNTGFIIEVDSLKPDFSRSTILPELEALGFDKSFVGLYVESAKITFPETLRDLIPKDIRLSEMVIGSGGVAGKISGSWQPGYDPGKKTFIGQGSGKLGGFQFGVTNVRIVLLQNSFQEAIVEGFILLPFFDEPISCEIQLLEEGDFVLVLREAGDSLDGLAEKQNGLYILRKESLVQLQLQSFSLAKIDNSFELDLGGQLTPLLPPDYWPTFHIDHLSIDSNGKVTFKEGMLTLRSVPPLQINKQSFALNKFGFISSESGGTGVAIQGQLSGLPIAIDDLYLSYIKSTNGQKDVFHIIAAGFQFVFDKKEGDGFISNVFPENALDFIQSFTIEYHSERGFRLSGSPHLSYSIDIRKQLGPLYLSKLELFFQVPPQKGLQLEAMLSGKMILGPVSFFFTDVGGRVELTPDKNGKWGRDQIQTRFRDPSGIGINLNVPLLSGGGKLIHDSDNHRYAGGLQLNLEGLSLKGTGLIATRLPDGGDGFSMIINMSAEFNPGIQLSFGFALTGVGGLIAVNRTFNLDALKDRMKTGALDRIMFPQNFLTQADEIISDLREIFPVKKKHFVVAPFLRIEWGTGNIFTIDIGLLMEFPFNGRIYLLGKAAVRLPDPKQPLVRINMDILGRVDLAEQFVRIEGKVRSSKVAGLPLEGGFAYFMSWDRPQFLMAMGGYHPRYKKPSRFPEVERLTTKLRYKRALILHASYYQAITSSSFQTGMAAKIRIKVGPFRAEGRLSFNALLSFDPFFFEAAIGISVAIKAFRKTFAGVGLSFVLSGPKPWRARGKATVKVLGAKKRLRFDFSWGGKQKKAPLYIKPIEILDLLVSELRKGRNWSARLPVGYVGSEKIRDLQEEKGEEGVVLHPFGILEVQQKAVPLNSFIERKGRAMIKDGIAKYQIVSPDESRQYLKTYFGVGQYYVLSKEEQLSTPEFERLDAGLRFGSPDEADFGMDEGDELISLSVDYETETIPKQKAIEDKAGSGSAWSSHQALQRRRRMQYRLSDQFGLLNEVPKKVIESKVFQVVDAINPANTFQLPTKTYAESQAFLKTFLKMKHHKLAAISLAKEPSP